VTTDTDLATIDITYFGRTVRLADLPDYAKFYRKLAGGGWERNTFAALERHVDENTVVLDIGAWIGVTPFWAVQKARSVIAVEPDPKCAAILMALALTEPRVKVIEAGLTDRKTLAIHAVDGFGSSETSALDIGNGGSAVVHGVSLAALLAQAGDAPIFVKIDIEGYEYALPGELALLADPRVRAVQIAVHPQLYAKSLGGSRIVARLKAAVATWRLAKLLFGAFGPPVLTKYSGLSHYILRGVVFRRKAKGADLLFVRPRSLDRNSP